MKRSLKKLAIDLTILPIFLAFFISSILIFLAEPDKVQGTSMEPTLKSGDSVITEKALIKKRKPQRGDVVVFTEDTTNQTYIKRIVGLPEEKVKLVQGKIYVNGEELAEPYLANQTVTGAGSFLKEDKGVLIPSNHYLVLGDNRESSIDSRDFGFVDFEDIKGAALAVYWPAKNLKLIER